MFFFRKPNIKPFNKKKLNILKNKSFEPLIIDIKSNEKINSK